MPDDDEVVAYEDHTTFTGRKIFRNLQNGRKVDPQKVDAVVHLDKPPLSSYFTFRGRN